MIATYTNNNKDSYDHTMVDINTTNQFDVGKPVGFSLTYLYGTITVTSPNPSRIPAKRSGIVDPKT